MVRPWLSEMFFQKPIYMLGQKFFNQLQYLYFVSSYFQPLRSDHFPILEFSLSCHRFCLSCNRLSWLSVTNANRTQKQQLDLCVRICILCGHFSFTEGKTISNWKITSFYKGNMDLLASILVRVLAVLI